MGKRVKLLEVFRYVFEDYKFPWHKFDDPDSKPGPAKAPNDPMGKKHRDVSSIGPQSHKHQKAKQADKKADSNPQVRSVPWDKVSRDLTDELLEVVEETEDVMGFELDTQKQNVDITDHGSGKWAASFKDVQSGEWWHFYIHPDSGEPSWIFEEELDDDLYNDFV